MFGPYKVFHLCGVTRDHRNVFQEAEEYLTKQGHICFKPVFYDFDIYLQYADLLDNQCYEKLLVCDAICIVTPKHIGKSTALRIQQAKELGKEIWVYENQCIIPFEKHPISKLSTLSTPKCG